MQETAGWSIIDSAKKLSVQKAMILLHSSLFAGPESCDKDTLHAQVGTSGLSATDDLGTSTGIFLHGNKPCKSHVAACTAEEQAPPQFGPHRNDCCRASCLCVGSTKTHNKKGRFSWLGQWSLPSSYTVSLGTVCIHYST